MLSRRHGQSRSHPHAPQEPHRYGVGPAQAAPRAAGVYDRHLGRHPQRYARDALLADRARGDPRRAVRAPERDRPRRHDRGGGLRQAAGRDAGCAAGTQPAGDYHVGWPDPSRHRPQDWREARHRQCIPGRRTPRRRASPAHRLPRLPWDRQLRRHVHLQHHADVHWRGRYAAAAHGGAAIRRSAPAEAVSGRAGGSACQADR